MAKKSKPRKVPISTVDKSSDPASASNASRWLHYLVDDRLDFFGGPWPDVGWYVPPLSCLKPSDDAPSDVVFRAVTTDDCRSGKRRKRGDLALVPIAERILIALLELEAIDRGSRERRADIVRKAHCSEDRARHLLSDLVKAGFVASARQSGGYWLTSNGHEVAERLRKAKLKSTPR